MMKLSSMYGENLIDNGSLVKKLEELKNSNKVYLTNMQIDDNSCLQISKFMLENDILVKLEATDGNITSRGLAHLSDAISKSKTLKTICLARNKITDIDDSSFSYFTIAISSSHTVRELDLSHNTIGFNCCQHIANLIKSNSVLESINLSQNSIGNEGCSLIIEALALNTNLKTLILEGNGIKMDLLQKVNNLIKQNRNSNSLTISTLLKSSPNEKASPTSTERLSLGSTDYFQKYKKLLSEHNNLKEEFSNLKKAYETAKGSYDLTKSGFSQKIEHERSLRISKEQELNQANMIIQEHQLKISQINNDQKVEYENEKRRLETELIEKIEENTRLAEINSNYENMIKELQLKNDTLGQDQLIRVEEFQDKINSIKKEYLDSRSGLVNQLEQDKSKIAQDELDQVKLKNRNEDLERKYNSLIKKYNWQVNIEKKTQEDCKIKLKELNEKINDLQSTIINYKKEILTKDEEIINLKKKYDFDVTELQTNLSNIDMTKSQKIVDQKHRNDQLEDALAKLKMDFNQEKIKLVNDENNKFIKAEDLFNRRYNDVLLRCEELEKTRTNLEEEITKQKRKIELLKTQFENEKLNINQQAELKCNQSNLGREEMLVKNKELLLEIESMKMKLNNQTLFYEENKNLKTENLTYRQTLEELKIRISANEKELFDKTNILNKLKIDLDAITMENQKMKADLSLSSQSVNNVGELQIAFSNLQKQYNDLQNQMLFYQNEFTKAKAYSNSLLEGYNTNFEISPSSISQRIIEQPPIEYALQPVTKYVRKTIKIPNSMYTACPSPKFNSTIK